jgi:Golgi apyrase
LDPFQAIDKVDGTELSWTLGKMVLYASSQMPAAEQETLAVGFGSNTPGLKVPVDFQYPSSKLPILGNDTTTDEVSSQDWHDRLLNSSYSRRAPGILIFLLILALAAYLLCGRDRRASLTSRFLGRKPNTSSGNKRPKPGFSLSSKLFGSSSSTGPAYERVLEAGAEDSDSENFELTAMSDDGHSSITTIDPPRTGRTSGWATPANRGLSPDFSRGSPKHKSYFDGPGAAAGSAANGLGITAFERGGLVVRTDSKEKLYSVGAGGAGGGGGSSSRSRTPGSARTPVLTPFKVGMD